MWAITEITNNTTKIIANHLAISSETPEISPKPNTAATIAIIKNTIAQANQPPTPFLFIFFSIVLKEYMQRIYTCAVLCKALLYELIHYFIRMFIF